MLTWEYPPRIVGGISRAVEGLSKGLARRGVEVHVVTNEFPGAASEEGAGGVFIHRAPVEISAPNFHSWVLIMNHFFSKRVAHLKREVGGLDVVHFHDWLTMFSGVEAKHSLGSACAVTLHSLEFRRSGDVVSAESRMVDGMEWWSSFEASLIIVCSGFMKGDVLGRFKVPEGKVWVIPNGVDAGRFDGEVDRGAVRRSVGVRDDEQFVLFVGRLTPQKGCEYLLRALPSVEARHRVKLVVAGDGWARGALENEVAALGRGWQVRFLGFVRDEELVQLLKAADLLVVPSVYEPFGVVALEGMAAGVPVVASRVDGLAEVVRHDYSGVLAYPRDPASIAWGMNRVLGDQGLASRLVANGRQEVVTRFSWDAIAELTLAAYRQGCGVG